MAKNEFQYGGWNYYTLQCDTIMTLISPGDCTLQYRMWLWNHDSEFVKWKHPAMWYVALGWHAMAFAQMSAILEFYIISPQSTCHSATVCEILSKSDHPQQRKMTSCRFSRWRISAILDFGGPIMASLKSPCRLRLPIGRQYLNCLVFEKIAFLAFWRHTDRRSTDRQTH